MKSLKTCSDCGEELREYEGLRGQRVKKCPECEGDPRIGEILYHRCRGCWKVEDCIAHHVSYNPEIVVPVCQDCHSAIHYDTDAFPHLTPTLKRSEAEERGLLSVITLESTQYEPVKVEKRERW